MQQGTPNRNTVAPDAAAASAPVESAGPNLPAPAGGPLKITSEKLFGGALEVQIDHHGALYRLKKTSLGKLILTK